MWRLFLLFMECYGLFGGRKVNYTEYNYVVSIQNMSGEHYFSGAIISSYHVLTSCTELAEVNEHEIVPYPNLVKLRIAAGGTSKAPEALRYPEMAFIHPSCKWGPDIVQYDLGLLKVSEAWEGNVGRGRLPSEDWVTLDEKIVEMIEKAEDCYVIGWYDGKIKTSPLRLSNWEQCKKEYCHECYNFEAANICTYPKDGVSLCDGDQGGPLICRDEIWGVIGYPRTVCGKPHYQNYARVGTRSSKTWLFDIAGEFTQLSSSFKTLHQITLIAFSLFSLGNLNLLI